MSLNDAAISTAAMGAIAAILGLLCMRRALSLEKPFAFLLMRFLDFLTVIGVLLGTIFLYLPQSDNTRDPSTLASISDCAKFQNHCDTTECMCSPPSSWIALAVFLGFMTIPVVVVMMVELDSILSSEGSCSCTYLSSEMDLSDGVDRDNYSALEGGAPAADGSGVDVIVQKKSSSFKREVHVPDRTVEALREAIQEAFDFRLQDDQEMLIFRKGDLIVYNNYDVNRLRHHEESVPLPPA